MLFRNAVVLFYDRHDLFKTFLTDAIDLAEVAFELGEIKSGSMIFQQVFSIAHQEGL